MLRELSGEVKQSIQNFLSSMVGDGIQINYSVVFDEYVHSAMEIFPEAHISFVYFEK